MIKITGQKNTYTCCPSQVSRRRVACARTTVVTIDVAASATCLASHREGNGEPEHGEESECEVRDV